MHPWFNILLPIGNLLSRRNLGAEGFRIPSLPPIHQKHESSDKPPYVITLSGRQLQVEVEVPSEVQVEVEVGEGNKSKNSRISGINLDLKTQLLDLYDCDYDVVFEDEGALSNSNESCSLINAGAIVDSLKMIPLSECKKYAIRKDRNECANHSDAKQVTVVSEEKCFFSLFLFFRWKNVKN